MHVLVLNFETSNSNYGLLKIAVKIREKPKADNLWKEGKIGGFGLEINY